MTADGHTTLFDFRNCEHLSRHLETVDEIRPAKAWYHMAAGSNAAAAASAFAREIAALVREHGGGGRIAYDRIDPAGAAALAAEGLVPIDGLALLDFARAIKSADEIKAMCEAIRACEEALRHHEYIDGAYDGVLAEGMVLCVESYVGEPGGRDGVKLEEQVLITAGGAVKLSAFPFDGALL